VVEAGLAAGLDFSGADLFYGGAEARIETACPAVRAIENGRIPFSDATFDLAVNNQVMEHVEDLDGTLAELDRVLKPGGAMLSIFPARDVWREGHIGIPFSHRLPKGAARFYYTWALRRLGCGTWKNQAPDCRTWAVEKLRWIDAWTHYRSRAEIFRAYSRFFESELREPEYIRYRLRPGLRWVMNVPLAGAAGSAVFRKLAFLVIVSRKVKR
jgi:SAM-dependent methyltransferase